jgi:adenylyltransferase/sulfurtransferase
MVVGGVQTAEAIKLVVNPLQQALSRLLVFDLWDFTWKTIDLSSLSETGCLSCRDKDYQWLNTSDYQTTILCGQDAVQLYPKQGTLNLHNIAKQLGCFGNVKENRWLVRTEVEPGIVVSVFADGRLIVTGTRDPSRARSIVSKTIGM